MDFRNRTKLSAGSIHRQKLSRDNLDPRVVRILAQRVLDDHKTSTTSSHVGTAELQRTKKAAVNSAERVYNTKE